MEIELKSCPFCGSTDIGLGGKYMDEETMDDLIGYYGYCNDCTANGPVDGTEIGAKILWNHRPCEN
jgi:Lar family restriction alleviation protein